MDHLHSFTQTIGNHFLFTEMGAVHKQHLCMAARAIKQLPFAINGLHVGLTNH